MWQRGTESVNLPRETVMAMDNVEIVDELSCLVQSDINAMHAYGQALPLMSSAPIRDYLIRFRRDHERHIYQLSVVIRAFDVEPPILIGDLKGFVPDGFPALEKPAGIAYALLAMKTNEERMNQKYRQASLLDLTPNIKELVRRNYQDEQIHLRFMEEVLAERKWMEWN